MTFTNGQFEEETAESILDAMIADAENYWNEDLNDTSLNVIRTFYRPIAERLANAQTDIGLVLEATQIDHANDQALDLLTALIGVKRNQAQKATGRVTFSRDTPATTDYTAPTGTTVQTDAIDPVQFKTTDSAVINGPESQTDSTTYATSNTSFVTKTSFTVDTTFRETVDVSADFRTTNSSYTAYLEVADATNATAISSNSTTNTSFVTDGPTTYDVSGLSGDITIEYRIRIGNSSGTAELTNSSLDKGGETGARAPIKAVNGGPKGNVAATTITVMPDPPTGIEDVINNSETTGGKARETDDELRQRAKDELAEGSRASAPALVNSINRIDGVTSVNIYFIDSDGDGNTDDGFELVVEGGATQDIADKILWTMASGDTSHGGVNGTKDSATVDLSNGQSFTIEFSRPTTVKISVDADITKTDEFSGKDAVRDSIVKYIGGLLSSGNETNGLDAGEDVIFGEVRYAIREVEGVYDISNLTVDTSATSGNTSNIAIASTEVATSDATDGSMTFTTTSK